MNLSYAADLARALMNEHGLGHWVFQYDRARRRAGCCKYGKKTISLSYHYVMRNEEEEVKDTILHEIAHALAGYKAAHGPAWKAVCYQIGAKPERCYGRQVEMPKGRYKAVCPNCGVEFFRHRRPPKGFYHTPCGVELGKLEYK